MKRFLILLLTFSAISSGVELGAKLGVATVKFSGERTSFILPVYIYSSVYADPDIHLTDLISLGPSVEFGYGEYSIGGRDCPSYKSPCTVKSGYAFLELNGKVKLHLGSYLRLFGGGGISLNRFYLDVYDSDDTKVESLGERIFTAVQAFGGTVLAGLIIDVEENISLGFEFKRKVPSLEEIEYIDSYNLMATYIF